jgi:flagellar basal body rod protein FlgC
MGRILQICGYATQSWVSAGFQPLDADLTSIAGLAGTSGLLKKTAANTWTLDTSVYLTGITSSQVNTALGYTPYDAANPTGYITASSLSNYQPLDSDLTAIAAITSNNGFLKKSSTNTWYIDNNLYQGYNSILTGITNQTVGNGILRINNGTVSLDEAAYIKNGDNCAIFNSGSTLLLYGTNVSSVSTSTWNPQNLTYQAWGQTFVNTAVGSGDGGKIVMWLRAGQYTSGAAELNLTVNGDFYSNNNKVWHAGNLTSGQVISILGYTPYNGTTNPNGYITLANVSNFATQSWVSSNYLGLHSRADLALGLDGTYVSGGQEKPDYFKYYGAKVQMINLGGWSDMLYLNGYGPTNGSGFDVPYVNAIAFQKTPNGSVYHSTSSHGSTSWGTWYKFLDENNYNSFSPKLDGTGSYGTWGINISGTAVNATTAAYWGTSGTVTYNTSYPNIGLQYIMGWNGTNSCYTYYDSSHIQSWLGINNSSVLSNYSKGVSYNTYVSPDGAYYSDPSTFGSFVSNTGTLPSFADCYILGLHWTNGNYVTQLALDVDPTYAMAIRHKDSGGSWNAWKNILT